MLTAEPLAQHVAFESPTLDGGLGRGDAVRVFLGADVGQGVLQGVVGPLIAS